MINISKKYFALFLFFFALNNIVFADEGGENIKEFLTRYLNNNVEIDVNKIFISKEQRFPQFIGYVENKAIIKLDKEKGFFYISFSNNPVKIYRVEKYLVGSDTRELKNISEIKKKEEIFNKIEPILEYFELPKKIEEYKFQLSPPRDLWRIIWNPTYKGFPCRMAGFKADVFSDTCKIKGFAYVPIRIPINTVPQLDTEPKAWEIAKLWLDGNEYFKDYLHDIPRYLDQTKKGTIVVTFPMNAFIKVIEPPKEKREFMYSWEIPFIWETNRINHGVIWVDVETEQVIGAGPYESNK